MDQTALDFEMLPEWVQSGVHTHSFLGWLLEEDNLPWETEEVIVAKVRQREFLFLYLAPKECDQELKVKEGLAFAGIFCRRNYGLYDVSGLLRHSLGIPEDVNVIFPDKEKAEVCMEQEIKEKISDLITNHWDEILSEKKYETRQLIPALKREEVRDLAERFYLEGLTADEVAYKPPFAFRGKVPDSYYLSYLEYGPQAVKAMAMSWICKRVPALSRKKILYGCIREEMRQIPADGRLAKIRQIRGILAGLCEETVSVEFGKEGKATCIRMKASDLMEPRGKYPLTCLAARERAQLKNVYGKLASAGLQVDDIQSVTWNRQILYVANEKQEAA